FLLLLRIQQHPTWRDYILLGLCGGLGILSKYNYAYFAASLGLAMLTLPQWRSVLLDRRLLLSLGLAGLIAAPHGVWMLQHLQEVKYGVVRYTEEKQKQFSSVEASIRHISTNIVQNVGRSHGYILLPVLLIFLPAWRATRRSDRETIPELFQLLVRYYLLGALLLACIMILGGVHHIRQHWLTSFAIFIPLLFLPLLDPDRLRSWQWHGYRNLLTLLVVGALLWRIGLLAWYSENGCLSSKSYQHDQLRQQLQATHWDESGTIIADHPYTAGYLRLYYPLAKVDCLYFPSMQKPRRKEPLLVAWRNRGESPDPPLIPYMLDQYQENIATEKTRIVVQEPANKPWRDQENLGSIVLPIRPYHSAVKAPGQKTILAVTLLADRPPY
ncbi:MAG TPA: glycosyltransferase family 39 protein, partial [Gemmatales bacterium]|nr:glycosyltransferase family 39 protein [Gemmatales bacterium]